MVLVKRERGTGNGEHQLRNEPVRHVPGEHRHVPDELHIPRPPFPVPRLRSKHA